VLSPRTHDPSHASPTGLRARPADRLEAHAWLELQGYVVIGLLPDLNRFIPMPSLNVDWR
jgi:hypothetical protein